MNDCLFCKIVAGEIPSYKVYEDDATFAFLDISPVHEGHTLIVPKKHATTIFDIDSASWAAVTETVRMLAGPIEQAMQASGVNIMMNNRDTAGQVIDHVHVHIIPRFKGDGLHLWPQHPYAEGAAETTRQMIIAAL